MVGGRSIETYLARATAVLVGARWLTAGGHPKRLSHYHRNLVLGVMQVQALVQLVAELETALEDGVEMRHSAWEFARNAVLMLHRVQDGHGTYRSELLEALVSRHGSALTRVAARLGVRAQVAAGGGGEGDLRNVFCEVRFDLRWVSRAAARLVENGWEDNGRF